MSVYLIRHCEKEYQNSTKTMRPFFDSGITKPFTHIFEEKNPKIFSSPFKRCIETAISAFGKDADINIEPEIGEYLGNQKYRIAEFKKNPEHFFSKNTLYVLGERANVTMLMSETVSDLKRRARFQFDKYSKMAKLENINIYVFTHGFLISVHTGVYPDFGTFVKL